MKKIYKTDKDNCIKKNHHIKRFEKKILVGYDNLVTALKNYFLDKSERFLLSCLIVFLYSFIVFISMLTTAQYFLPSLITILFIGIVRRLALRWMVR